MSMTIKHYELAAEDNDITFSPYCWRTRMALLHKDVPFTTVPWYFADKSATQASGSSTVPVIETNGSWVTDSWDIAHYLDETYPDQPKLFPNEESIALAKLVDSICKEYVFPVVVPIAVPQVYKILGGECQTYFRKTREAFFGTALENIYVEPQTGKENLAKALLSFDNLLADQPYLCGESPAYADYILYGILKWVDIVSSYETLDKDSITGKWFVTMDNLFDGHGRNAKNVRMS